MFEEVDALTEEILNVQVLDCYFRDNKIYLDDAFVRSDYIQELKKMDKLLKCYQNNNLMIDCNDKYEEDVEYTLDDVSELLVADLDVYALIYNVPTVKINNNEWDLFFSVLANYYETKEYSYFFINDMVLLNKMVIAKSLVYEDDCIDLNTYITSLKYIESDTLSINDIIEVTSLLGKTFNIDALSLIRNSKGEYGCIGKDFKTAILNGEEQNLDVGQIIDEQIQRFNSYKLKENIVEEKQGKIIDFNKHKSTRRK